MKRKQRKSKYQLNMPDVKGAAGSFFKNAGNKARALLHRGGRRASQSLDRGAARLGEPPIPSGTRPLLLVIDLLLLIAAAGSVAFAVISATADSGQIAVTLNANGLSREFAIWPATVEEFLDANGIEHDPDDEISLPLEAQLQDGDTLTVRRCFPVAVHTKGATSLLRYTQGTVGDALSAAGVTADADDEISYLTFRGP